ncbi:MEDS domain-containing protein [Geodermatophilus sp. URMC 63]
MTVPRELDSPTGLLPGDHVCWTFPDAAGLAAAVVPFLDEGRRLGEQLLLVGASRPVLLTATDGLPGRDELLDSGQLQLRTLEDAYAAGGELVPAEQVRRYRDTVRAALDGGRSGLRVAADISALAAAGRPALRQLHAYEQLADVLVDEVPMTALCLYDAAAGHDVLGPVAVLHPAQHLGGREPLAHLSGRGTTLALHGEVDRTEAAHVATALTDVAGGTPGELVLDLTDLRFLDVAGARALEGAVRELAARGTRVRMTGARRAVLRCLDLFGLDLFGLEAEGA